MEQRRLRLGDILDDYCPRERRVTNHVVVAMIEDEIKQTRCSTCDAEHPYKGGKAPRRRKPDSAVAAPPVTAVPHPAEADRRPARGRCKEDGCVRDVVTVTGSAAALLAYARSLAASTTLIR